MDHYQPAGSYRAMTESFVVSVQGFDFMCLFWVLWEFLQNKLAEDYTKCIIYSVTNRKSTLSSENSKIFNILVVMVFGLVEKKGFVLNNYVSNLKDMENRKKKCSTKESGLARGHYKATCVMCLFKNTDWKTGLSNKYVKMTKDKSRE